MSAYPPWESRKMPTSLSGNPMYSRNGTKFTPLAKKKKDQKQHNSNVEMISQRYNLVRGFLCLVIKSGIIQSFSWHMENSVSCYSSALPMTVNSEWEMLTLYPGKQLCATGLSAQHIITQEHLPRQHCVWFRNVKRFIQQRVTARVSGLCAVTQPLMMFNHNLWKENDYNLEIRIARAIMLQRNMQIPECGEKNV